MTILPEDYARCVPTISEKAISENVSYATSGSE